MSLSKKEIEKIYNIKDKLTITYKAATNNKQKKRIYKHLQQINKVIDDIEDGKYLDLNKLNIFSEDLNMDEIYESDLEEIRINYLAKVENLKISNNNKDSEMNQIYSFINYFEKNFSTPLGNNYLKLEYNLSKKRDTFFSHFEGINHLLNEYIDDINVLSELKFKEQIEQFKFRINQQKKYILVRLSEVLHEFKELISNIILDYDKGLNSIFNPNERYIYKYPKTEKTDFDGIEMINILKEASYFIDDFLSILRMPDFRKKTKS